MEKRSKPCDMHGAYGYHNCERALPEPRSTEPLGSILRDLSMIRHDLAKLVGPRDALVRMADDLLCGIEEQLNTIELRKEKKNV